jgi:membrane protein
MKQKKIKKWFDKFKSFLINVWEILKKPEMAILPGQLAFFLLLSLVPILTLIGYGASFFNISIDSIIDIIRDNFSNNIGNMIIPIISGEKLDFKLVIVLIIMFYLSSNGAASIIITSNQIYGVKQSSWFKRRIKAIFLTLLIVILYLFILIVPAYGNNIINAIDYFNIKSTLTSVLTVLNGPISWLIIFCFMKVLFTIAPDKKVPANRVNLGAIFTTFGIIIVTDIYSYYITHFAHYDIFYAGLSNIAILMLWIYFLSYIIVIGISLTSKFDDDLLPKTGVIN